MYRKDKPGIGGKKHIVWIFNDPYAETGDKFDCCYIKNFGKTGGCIEPAGKQLRFTAEWMNFRARMADTWMRY